MKFINRIKIPLFFILIFWVIELLEVFVQKDFHELGVYPRSIYGLAGIFFMPFLHGGIPHLFSNTPSFLLLCGSLFYFYPKIAKPVLFQSYLFTGIGIWLFARGGEFNGLVYVKIYHIGASGLIYAFAGFLFFNGAFRKDSKSLGISLSVAVLYFGMWQGLIPNQPGISWESHLIGAIVGSFLAYRFKSVSVTEKANLASLETDEPIISEGVQPLENEYFKYEYKDNSGTE
jgi:membrane associated rhomboid family serine protease